MPVQFAPSRIQPCLRNKSFIYIYIYRALSLSLSKKHAPDLITLRGWGGGRMTGAVDCCSRMRESELSDKTSRMTVMISKKSVIIFFGAPFCGTTF